MAQIGEEKKNHEKEKVLNSNSNSSPNSKNLEEKKTEAEHFWIPVHIIIPERPTECSVFNVIADSPRDPIQFIEWSPSCCPCALLIAKIHGRVTIWTQPSQGPANFVLDTSCWLCEHEWWQEISVATKWLPAMSPYGRLPSKSSASANSKSMFQKFISQQSQTSTRWPNFFCVCSVLSSGLV
ncbi:unnamed protein product [Vicia faba]|uniref:Uncharacterized protein n=1 Tax=Vicia faba TaxID=3906 RepID=A0AAV1A059_VICFA|nr:unnamed protein product [Vicia faba]